MFKQNHRAREPISRSFGLMRGKFPSRKMSRMIHWESQLERDAVLLFEFSPGVVAYREQPLTTHYTLNGKTRRYTPDFELTLITGDIWLVEVKPAIKLLQPKEQQRFNRIQEHFAQKGYGFRLMTDKDIRQPVLLTNLKTLSRDRAKPISVFDKRRLVGRLNGISSITWADAVMCFKGQSVWQLIDQGILFCDLRSPVNEQTVLTIGSRENGDARLFF